jgi:hypothetical protein
MKLKAPNLFRWTERMNLAGISDGEFAGYGEDYAPDDSIPETLIAVLALVFRDWTPGLIADVNCFNAWAADKSTGNIVSREGQRQVHPNIGPVSYPFHGIEMKRGSAPHAVWMFSAALDQAGGLETAAAERFAKLLKAVGGETAFNVAPVRRMARKNNVLILS